MAVYGAFFMTINDPSPTSRVRGRAPALFIEKPRFHGVRFTAWGRLRLTALDEWFFA